ncbi:MAG TPA: GNAT family N-acetyltransferase [Burkholderiales bacterium]|nr:GNAT family N-acetyltransferase [Burkholderiales bacterium]
MIEIEPFSDRHRNGVVAVVLPIQEEESGIPVTLDAQPDLLDIPGFYQKGAGNFWVALADGEVVGTVSLPDIGHGQGALRKMFVKAPFRGPAPGDCCCQNAAESVRTRAYKGGKSRPTSGPFPVKLRVRWAPACWPAGRFRAHTCFTESLPGGTRALHCRAP